MYFKITFFFTPCMTMQEESNRVVNWLKEIKESHGSVEVTSLKQVDAIKERGVFKVGSSGKNITSKHQLVRKFAIGDIHFFVIR